MSISITLVIIVITGLVSYQSFEKRALFEKLKHYPVAEKKNKEYYRFLSSGFVHGSWGHLIINMYVLYMFGEAIEYQFSNIFGSMGRILFIIFYLSAIVVADIPTYIKHQNNPGFASIGASGAVAAIVFAFIMFNPWNQLVIIFIPFLPFPAILGGIAYLIYTSWASKNKSDHIDHSAHFAGAIYGMLFLIIMKPALLTQFVDKIMNGLPF